MQRLFNVGKVGLFVDAVALGKEKRKNGEEAPALAPGGRLMRWLIFGGGCESD